MKRKGKKNQRRVIRHEFEPVGPTMLKNPLGAGWGLLPTLHISNEIIYGTLQHKVYLVFNYTIRVGVA